MEKRPELLKSSTESLLLCLISQQSMYGYQIVKELEKQSHGYFTFKEGTLYPALHRLENRGLIAGNWEMLTGSRQRRYYKITEKGLEFLSLKRNQWQSFLDAMNLIIKPSET